MLTLIYTQLYFTLAKYFEIRQFIRALFLVSFILFFQSINSRMANLQERADSALYTVAQKCEGGMPEIMGHFFSFLARRTEFFSKNTPEECEKQLLNAYDRQCDQMDKIMRIKRQQREEAEMRERKLLRQQVAMEKAKKVEEEAKKALEEKIGERVEASESVKPERQMPNEGNGCDLPTYKWTQTLDKIELFVPFKVDFKLMSRDVIVDFKKKHLKVGLRNLPAVIDGDLFGEIVVNDDCTWSLNVNDKIVTILMPKKRNNQFWSKLVVTDPEINIKV